MIPQAFFIKNHSASDLHKADIASLPTLSERPKFASKDEYQKWCHDSTTDHIFYVLYEPEFAGTRSSRSNPIKFMHGIVADYDGDPSVIAAALPQLKFGPGKAPTWVTTTFSNKARLIWAFEKPVPVFSPDVLDRLLATFKKELKLTGILPGLDEGAYEKNVHTPFELGTNWRQPYGDTRIPGDVVMLALHDACNRTKWKVEGPEIPMEAVEAEVNKRWPGRWVGPFVEGARGIRFWDAKADNPTGATIRNLGVQAWTGEAKFIPWGELLGAEFVKQYRANRIGGAIDGTYFDGQAYWRRDESNIWRDHTTESMKRHLNVSYGLSTEGKKGQASEVSQALTTIDNIRRVDGAFPCLFMRDDIVCDVSQKYLNIARAKPVPNDGTPRAWGDGFPWLSAYLTGLFGDKQLDVFLSWLAHFYKSAAAGTPRKGQALFVAGPQSAGKTFLSQRVVGGLMGGFQEATSYILGDTNFNEQLFHAPVWAVDDAVAGADQKRHAVYSQIVKKIVANPYQEYHAKFKKAVTFRWNGRLIVTLNDDPTSIGMLPSIEGSILDKIVLLRAFAPGVSFSGADDKVGGEMPAFADFLANYTTPEWLTTRAEEVIRFGHDSFHHADLLETAKEGSAASGLLELLSLWRTYHFRAKKDGLTPWKGSAMELLGEMKEMDIVKNLVQSVASTHRILGRDLQKLIAQGTPWLSYGKSDGSRQYIINRPETL
jgi:hypothetical protein